MRNFLLRVRIGSARRAEYSELLRKALLRNDTPVLRALLQPSVQNLRSLLNEEAVPGILRAALANVALSQELGMVIELRFRFAFGAADLKRHGLVRFAVDVALEYRTPAFLRILRSDWGLTDSHGIEHHPRTAAAARAAAAAGVDVFELIREAIWPTAASCERT